MKTFGETLRSLRLAKGITLREFARQLGVSAPYISQVEQDRAAAPVKERVTEMAHLLRVDPDELLAAAGRLADDLPAIIWKRPREMASFLRTVDGLSTEKLQKLQKQAKRLAKEKA